MYNNRGIQSVKSHKLVSTSCVYLFGIRQVHTCLNIKVQGHILNSSGRICLVMLRKVVRCVQISDSYMNDITLLI